MSDDRKRLRDPSHRDVCRARAKERLAGRALQGHRCLTQAPARLRRVLQADKAGPGYELQVAGGDQRADGIQRHAGGSGDLCNREDFSGGTGDIEGEGAAGKSLASLRPVIQAG